MTRKDIEKDFEEWSGFKLNEEDLKSKESLQKAYKAMANTLSDEVYQHERRMAKIIRGIKLPECQLAYYIQRSL